MKSSNRIREKSIVAACLRKLNAIPGCRAVKRHGSIYSRAGEPDLDVVYRGQAFKLEVKRPGEKATPAQNRELELWRRAGAVVGVCYSASDAIKLILGSGSSGAGMTAAPMQPHIEQKNTPLLRGRAAYP